MTAAIPGGMFLSATGSISGMANYSRNSLRQGMNVGHSNGNRSFGFANKFRGSGSSQVNKVSR